MIKKHQLFFWACMAILFLLYNYAPILSLRPRSVHQWAQCDRASLALNFYKENRSFFSPSVNFIGGYNTGQAVSEMPLIQYGVAQLWKIFGFHEWIYRSIELIILFAGLYYLFLLFRLLLKNNFLAIISTVLIFTSPVLVFYGNNFLSDVPSFSFVIIGWYFFFRFYESLKKKHFAWCMFFFMLAGWLKISSLISAATIGGIYLLEFIPSITFRKKEKLLPDRLFVFACFLFLFAGIFAWYSFAIYYNRNHNEGTFLTQTLPIWKYTSSEIQMIFNNFYIHVLKNFFHPVFLGLLLASLVLIVTVARKVNPLMAYLSGALFLGIVAIFLLFFKNFEVHDYYLVQLIIGPVFILASLFLFLQKKAPRVISSTVFIVLLGLFTVYQVAYATTKMSIRYFYPKNINTHHFFVGNDEVARMQWVNWHYENFVMAFETIEPYNRSLGIRRFDRVISIPDESLNITLYLMDQKGFTFSGIEAITEKKLTQMIDVLSAKYIFISDPAMYESEALKPFLKNKIGSYQNIDIYRADKKLLN